MEDWEPIECIIGPVEAYHSSIGQQIYKDQKGTSLAESGIFFYDHHYQVPTSLRGYGSLTELPLPGFESKNWDVPSLTILQSFKAKIYNEVQKCLKTNIASKQSRVSVFLPLEVFVYLFKQQTIRTAKTMFSITGQNKSMLQFLKTGWDEKTTDNVQCRIDDDTVQCKYMIGNQNFILLFHYSRWHKVNGKNVALDQENDDQQDNQIIEIDICMGGEILCMIKLREQNTLRQLRMDIQTEGELSSDNFQFLINQQRVAKRRENTIKCIDLHQKKIDIELKGISDIFIEKMN